MSFSSGPMSSPAVGTPEASSSAQAADRSTAFQASQGTAEQVPGGKLLVAAYAVLWLLVFVLIARIFFRQRSLEKQLSHLNEALLQKEKQRMGS